MEKIYTYKNATITINEPTKESTEMIKKATIIFSKRIIKERSTNGNNDKTRAVRE